MAFEDDKPVVQAVLYEKDGSGSISVPASGDSTASKRGIGILGRTAANLFRFLLVQNGGELVVASSPPAPPPGTTEFVFAISESEIDVGSGGQVASPHTSIGAVIANGVNLFIQSISAGQEGDPAESGSVVEIFWREGAGPTDHLIARIFVGPTVSFLYPNTNKTRDGTQMTGNGTNTRLVVKRTRLSTAALQVDFDVRGYTS